MPLFRIANALALALILLSPAYSQPKRKKLLAIGAVKGFQHDATSHGLATIWKIGQESGVYDTYIRTDTQLLTKRKLEGNAKTLDFFDAVLFYTTGELDMDDSQKADLLAFVRDDGKGFIGVHSAIDTFYKWPEYGEMVGGYFDLHPWNQFEAPIVVEDPVNPIVKHFSREFTIMDEIYQVKDYSRDRVRVLMSMDPAKLDLKRKGVRRADGDFAVAWIRNYGKGRVFYSTFGHREDAWDRTDVQKMWLEAIKWSMGLTQADATPRPKPAPAEGIRDLQAHLESLIDVNNSRKRRQPTNDMDTLVGLFGLPEHTREGPLWHDAGTGTRRRGHFAEYGKLGLSFHFLTNPWQLTSVTIKTDSITVRGLRVGNSLEMVQQRFLGGEWSGHEGPPEWSLDFQEQGLRFYFGRDLERPKFQRSLAKPELIVEIQLRDRGVLYGGTSSYYVVHTDKAEWR